MKGSEVQTGGKNNVSLDFENTYMEGGGKGKGRGGAEEIKRIN